MLKIIHKLVLSGGMLLALNSYGQSVIVVDDLSWAPTSTETTTTSPNFNFCNGDSVNYTISTPNQGDFRDVVASGNLTFTSGLVFPADPGANTDATIQIDFTFSQPVTNLKIKISDLDGNFPAETITSISPTYGFLTGINGMLTDPTGGHNAVNGSIENASGWIHWCGPITTTVSLTYNRPGSGYGLIIDGVEFSCTENQCDGGGCNCIAEVVAESTGEVDQDGFLNTSILIDTQGEAVSSVTIDLPFYSSLVDQSCLQCNVNAQQSYGTILAATSIAGFPGVVYDPMGLGYGRKIVYNFPTPQVIAESVQFDLQFPPVLDLACCENRVAFCLDVTLKKEDCSSCEYTVCNNLDEGGRNQEKRATNEAINDTPVVFEEEEAKGLVISPNPASEFIEINVVDEKLLGSDLTVSSATGSAVKSLKLKNRNMRINVEDFPNGMYILTVNSNERRETYNVVIQ